MYHGIEYSDVRITFEEILIILTKNINSHSRVLRAARSIVFVADLKNKLIERLLLFATLNVVKVVFDAAVFSFLLGIIFRQCRSEQLIIGFLDVNVAKHDIILYSICVYVLRNKLPIVMGNAPLANAYANGLFQ